MMRPQADVAVVNTCGFVEQAKKDSIDALLEASDLKGEGRTQKVVAVGCLAERYGEQLAAELPEADAVLGFDSYADMSSHLTSILEGNRPASHVPSDRRRLLPLSPASRQATAGVRGAARSRWSVVDACQRRPRERDDRGTRPGQRSPGHPRRVWMAGRGRPLKIACGCDRRCAFCAIPMFRGAFVSRRPADILAEARWLGEHGVKEIFLVSENSTSYGKDLGDLRLLETMLPELAAVEGSNGSACPTCSRPRSGWPARRHGLDAGRRAVLRHLLPARVASRCCAGCAGSASPQGFLDLIDQVRARAPLAGIRSNVIVGFPGETEEDLVELEGFLTAARLDVVGVFGYSDEDGTEAETYEGKLESHVIAERLARFTTLVEELNIQRAEERIGERVEVLVEGIDDGTDELTGRAAHQGPDVDGATILPAAPGCSGRRPSARSSQPRVVDTEGIDLVAEPV